MEARVSALETRLARVELVLDEIRAELKAVRADLTGLRVEVAELRAEMRGRLTNIPTTFQLVYMQGAFVLAIFAAAFALLRFAPPH
jgi:uncharacterized coiled-coil protein SlyX